MAERPSYLEPGWFTRNVFNRVVGWFTKLGVGFVGSRVLRVRGRTSGEWRETPVNPLSHDGNLYLVAARGETHWVRNLRARGEGELRVGRRRTRFRASELPDSEKPPLLRAYLKRWAWEVGTFFEGVGADADDEALLAEGRRHPIFRIELQK
jgi:deazaflavin-dependent oxidoreductase (nitroreductase family)